MAEVDEIYCTLQKLDSLPSDVENYDIVTFESAQALDKKFYSRVLEYSSYSHPYIQPPQWYHIEENDSTNFKGHVAYPKIGHEKMTDYLAKLKDQVEQEDFDKTVLKLIYQLSLGIDSLHQSKYAKRKCIVLRHICPNLLYVETNNGEPTARIRVQCAVLIQGSREDSNPSVVELKCKCEYSSRSSNVFNTVKHDWQAFGDVIEKILAKVLQTDPGLLQTDPGLHLDDAVRDRSILQFLYAKSGLMKVGRTDEEILASDPPYSEAHFYVKILHKENNQYKSFRIPNEPSNETRPNDIKKLCHACLREDREICPKTYLKQTSRDEDNRCSKKCCYYCHHCYTVAPLVCKEHGPAQSIFGGFALIVYGINDRDEFDVKSGNTFEQDATEFYNTLAHNSICNVPYENMISGPLYYIHKTTDSGFSLADESSEIVGSPKKKLQEYKKQLIQKIKDANVENPIVWFVYIGHGDRDGKRHMWDPIKSNKRELSSNGISVKDRSQLLNEVQQNTGAILRYVNCTCYANQEEIPPFSPEGWGDDDGHIQLHPAGEKTFKTTPQLICQIMRGGCHPKCQRDQHPQRYDGHGLLTSENLIIEASWQKICEKDSSDSREKSFTAYTCRPIDEAGPTVVEGTGREVLGMCQLHQNASFKLHKYNRGSTDTGCDFLYNLNLYIHGQNHDGHPQPMFMKDHPDLKKLKEDCIGVKKGKVVLFLTNKERGYSNYNLVIQHDMRAYLQFGTLYYVHDDACTVHLKNFCKQCDHSVEECRHHHGIHSVELPISLIEDPELIEFFNTKTRSDEKNGHIITEVPNLLMLLAYQLFHEYEEEILSLPPDNHSATQKAVYDILECFGVDMENLTATALLDKEHEEKYYIWCDHLNVLQYRHIKDSRHISRFDWDATNNVLTFKKIPAESDVMDAAPSSEAGGGDGAYSRESSKTDSVVMGAPDLDDEDDESEN